MPHDLRVQPLSAPDPALAAHLRSEVAEHPAGWASLPEVWLQTAEAPRTGRARALTGWVGTLGRAIAPRTGPRLVRVGDVLLVSSSIQTRRVLDPVQIALEQALGAGEQVFLPRLTARDIVQTMGVTKEVLAGYHGAFRSASLPRCPHRLGPPCSKQRRSDDGEAPRSFDLSRSEPSSWRRNTTRRLGPSWHPPPTQDLG